MAYAEKRGKGPTPWRVRYQLPDGKWDSRPGFATKRGALEWGRAMEADLRRDYVPDPRLGRMLVADYATDWLAGLDLEASTLAQYQSLVRNHIMPRWGTFELGELVTMAGEIAGWERELREAGLSQWTITSVTRRFATMLEDAVWEGLIGVNPARRRRRRGRAEAQHVEAEESLWADPVQVLAIARRLAELGGQRLYVMVLLMAYTGLRWAEAVGLEREYCLPLGREEIRVEWQLAEVGGHWERKPPKGGRRGRRTIPLPPFLAQLMRELLDEAHPCRRTGCGCGGRAHVFTGPDGGHPRRSNFARRYWRPACDGYPCTCELEQTCPRHPARSSPYGPAPKVAPDWKPVAPRLTPHDLRHSHKTWMLDDGVPEVAQAERLAHRIPGVRGIYSHVTEAMRVRLVEALQARWEASQTGDARRLRAVGD